MNKFTLAYCADNVITAKEIDRNLSNSGFEFQHVSCDNKFDSDYLGEKIPADQMVILLVSDNLLKSTACMYNSLPMIQRLSSEARVISLIVDGKYREKDGSIQSVSTSFDRVSHVIQYMNFWQDEYLELRKQKKQILPEQEESYENKLKIVRNISSEIGEFLRILRSVESYSFQEFSANNYKVFYYKTGNQLKHVEKAIPEKVAINQQQETVLDLPPKVEEQKAQVENIILENQPAEDSSTTNEEDHELLDKLVSYREEQNAQSTEVEDQMNELIEEVVEEEKSETPNIDTEEDQELSTEEILQSIFDEEEEEEQELNGFEEEGNPQEASSDEVKGNTPNEDIDGLEENESVEYEFLESDNAIPNPNYQKSLSDIEESIYEASRFAEDGNPQKALDILSKLLEANPENTLVRYQYAFLLDTYTNDQEAVISELQTIVTYQPLHVKANLKLASIAEERKDYLAAKNLYEKVISNSGAYPEIYYKLGIITSKHFVGQKEKAADYLKKAIKLDKSNSDAYYRYGVLLNESLGEPGKATKNFKRCLEIQKDHPFAFYDLALLHYKLGKYKKAKKYYLQACKNNPELKTEANDLAFENPPPTEKLTKKALDATMEEDQEIELMEEVLSDVTIEESLEIEEEVEEEIEEEEIELADEQLEPNPQNPALNNIVFITGASSGIGKATSIIFAKNGYDLILTGRRADRLAELKTNLEEEFGIQVQTLNFDVRDLNAVKESFDSLADEWKQVDILINNAGLAKGFAPIHEGSLDHWETMIDTNIKGLLFMTRAISPYMVEREQGHIINVGSTAGKEVYPNGNVYCATKFAVDALTKSMRLDLHKHNIRVSQVSPGHVEETEFALVRFDGDKERSKIYEDFQPLKSKDVAEVIYFMATRPAHVNIQDVLLMGTQQAGNNHINRSGRKDK